MYPVEDFDVLGVSLWIVFLCFVVGYIAYLIGCDKKKKD